MAEDRRLTGSGRFTSTAAQPAREAEGAASEETGLEVVRQDNREARIAELRKKYVDGKYSVDAREVSAKIVQKHLRK